MILTRYLSCSVIWRAVALILFVELMILMYTKRALFSPLFAMPPTQLSSSQEINGVEAFKVANAKRVDKLKSYCQKDKEKIVGTYLGYSLRSTPDWVWMHSRHHKLFYCALPKCGSTTWKSYLMEDAGINWEGIDTHEAAKRIGTKKSIDAMGGDRVSFLETIRPDHRMVIVRNPWARLVSAYQDKIVKSKWALQRLCRGWKKYQDVKEPTFTQFIDCVSHKPEDNSYGKYEAAAHTFPLTALCGVCQMDYNIIVNLENMGESTRHLMNILNFSKEPDYDPPQKVKTSNTHGQYYREVPQEYIKRLQDIYYYDIVLFDYPLDPFS